MSMIELISTNDSEVVDVITKNDMEMLHAILGKLTGAKLQLTHVIKVI